MTGPLYPVLNLSSLSAQAPTCAKLESAISRPGTPDSMGGKQVFLFPGNPIS
jgi:hypothetical protein